MEEHWYYDIEVYRMICHRCAAYEIATRKNVNARANTHASIPRNYQLVNLINSSRVERLDCTSNKHVADIRLFMSEMCVRQSGTVFSLLIDLGVYLPSN